MRRSTCSWSCLTAELSPTPTSRYAALLSIFSALASSIKLCTFYYKGLFLQILKWLKNFLADALVFKTQLLKFVKQSIIPIQISITEYANSPDISTEGIRDKIKEKNLVHF